ncbi:MAG: hypothetical protein K2N06_11770 [Oscillospiraceae bacterium]|nr:hypothetical protein [Oscillospiraceae bacterium]
MNAIFQLVNPANTVTVNRPLAHALGLNEAVIYGALISKFYYYSERGMREDGWFYSTAPDLAESTALSEKQQKRAVDNLVSAGLIRSELRGMPAKRSFYIVEDVTVLQDLIAAGEAKMREIKPAAAERYEKKRPTTPNPETQNLINFLSEGLGTIMPESDSENCEDHYTEIAEEINPEMSENIDENREKMPANPHSSIAPTKGRSKVRQKVGASSAETSEQHFIKSKYNNPEIINPSIAHTREDSADVIDGIDSQSKREFYFSILKENISYEDLCANNSGEKAQIDELLSIMLDVICSTKPTIRANGEEYPKELVKSVFLKLDEGHIDYVLTALKKNKTNVRNIRAYLITTLYNAPETIGSYYQAWVNHDLYGGEEK